MRASGELQAHRRAAVDVRFPMVTMVEMPNFPNIAAAQTDKDGKQSRSA